jgi:putative flippase GtrA
MRISAQLPRFCVVGAINTSIYVAVAAIGMGAFGLTQLLSNAIAYTVASSFSFFVNSVWSFAVSPRAHRYARFQLVGLIGMGVCVALGHAGDKLHWPYAITVLATALIAPLVSFLAHRWYTFA